MKKVTVFTSPTCGPCKLVKAWLQRKEIQYEEKSIVEQENANEAARKSGGLTVPVIDVDGRIIVGPNLPLLSELLMV